jgi:hypothetical protein
MFALYCSLYYLSTPAYSESSSISISTIKIYQPVPDWRKSPIQAIFLNKEDSSYEISIIFKDEKHPFPVGHLISLLYRKLFFGRQKDIETFKVYLSKNNIIVSFPSTYSDNQHLEEVLPRHLSKSFRLNSTIKDIDIFINTWNHLMSIYDSNPKYDKVVCEIPLHDNTVKFISCTHGKKVYKIPIFSGSRQDAEAFVINYGESN